MLRTFSIPVDKRNLFYDDNFPGPVEKSTVKNNRINSIFNSSTTAGYRAIITSIKLGSFPSFLFPLLLKGQGDLLGLILRNSIEMHPKKLVNLREKRKIHKIQIFAPYL